MGRQAKMAGSLSTFPIFGIIAWRTLKPMALFILCFLSCDHMPRAGLDSQLSRQHRPTGNLCLWLSSKLIHTSTRNLTSYLHIVSNRRRAFSFKSPAPPRWPQGGMYTLIALARGAGWIALPAVTVTKIMDIFVSFFIYEIKDKFVPHWVLVNINEIIYLNNSWECIFLSSTQWC